jgi:catechol 2,3-dioxygenase-like lactoylglutathione lyase family enzyme
MNFHLGRLIDHVQLVVADLSSSKRFYRAVLQSLGRDLTGEGDGYFFVDELYVSEVDESSRLSHIHIAFQAADRETVQRFHAAALAAGGRNNGAPGERHYHPGYYAAFVLDPDGNNIEVVDHGSVQRSAASVIVTPTE